MGMFDTVRSSYPLISPEADVMLQTKDLDCVMGKFWISPAGQLYRVETCQAYDGVEVSEEQRESPWQLIKWVRNGKHGSVTPDFRTALVELYPGQLVKGEAEWVRVRAFFKHGVIKDVTRET